MCCRFTIVMGIMVSGMRRAKNTFTAAKMGPARIMGEFGISRASKSKHTMEVKVCAVRATATAVSSRIRSVQTGCGLGACLSLQMSVTIPTNFDMKSGNVALTFAYRHGLSLSSSCDML